MALALSQFAFQPYPFGFGGISILMQTLSIIAKSELSITPYILGKLLHAIIAAIYTYLLLQT